MQGNALIIIKTFRADNLTALKKACNLVSEFSHVLALSSVYLMGFQLEAQDVHNITTNNSVEGLVVALALETPLPSEKLVSLIKTVENQVASQAREKIEIKLLLHDGTVRMRPSLVIPYPDFHKKMEDLMPAAELWPDGLHPVLKKSLLELQKSVKTGVKSQFYAQGKSLLDNRT